MLRVLLLLLILLGGGVAAYWPTIHDAVTNQQLAKFRIYNMRRSAPFDPIVSIKNSDMPLRVELSAETLPPDYDTGPFTSARIELLAPSVTGVFLYSVYAETVEFRRPQSRGTLRGSDLRAIQPLKIGPIRQNIAPGDYTIRLTEFDQQGLKLLSVTATVYGRSYQYSPNLRFFGALLAGAAVTGLIVTYKKNYSKSRRGINI